MGEIPDRQCAGGVRPLGQRLHVVKAAGAIVDLGQHQHRNRLVDGTFDFLRRGNSKRVSPVERSEQSFGHVEIGRKIAVVGKDHPPGRVEFECCGQRLIDLDRQGVADHHGAFGRADQPADAVADVARLSHPAGAVPAPDELLSPFLGHHVTDPIGRRNGQGAERVAVQIDDSIRDMEQGSCSREIGHRRSRSEARRILARRRIVSNSEVIYLKDFFDCPAG
jgi:hypothetical protein